MAFERGGRGGKPGGKAGGFKPGGAGGARKPYAKREGAAAATGGRKPYVKRDGDAARPYSPRGPRVEGRAEGAERRPYAPREGAEKRPYAKREGAPAGGFRERKRFSERKPYAPRGEGAERRPYKPREDGAEGGFRERTSFGERKPYVKREGGFGGERKPYTPRAPREGGYGDRPERAERPARAPKFDTRENQYFESKPLAEGFVFGTHAVVAVLQANRRKVRELWVSHEPTGALAEALATRPDVVPLVKAKPEFESQFPGLVHQGVAALVGNLPQPSLPEVLAGNPGLLLAVDQVTDPHNLGAIVRSCAAFGVAAVLVPDHRTAGVGPVVAKVAAGALETVPVVEIGNLANTLKLLAERGFAVLGLAGEDASVPLAEVQVGGPVCLVVGSEGEGLRRLTREHCTQLVKIPMQPAVESLNVSVATGIALFALAGT